MSKSYGNYVGVSEPPQEQFGKLMSISDETMATYYTLLLGEPLPEIHPMEAKKQLAARIVERFHSAEAAQDALSDFNTRFSKKDLAHSDLPEVAFTSVAGDILSVVVAAYQQGYSIQKSRAEARRLVEQGSIQLGGQKITNPKDAPTLNKGDSLRLDKTHAVRIG
jgi:tyrosyl-tRNA synthetase